MSALRNLPDKDITNLYLDGYSLRELSAKFNIDKKSIKNRLVKYGIKLRSLSEANRIYNVDESIFSIIDSHEKAYWLGFIASDGCVVKNTLKIGLSFKDYGHLEKFKMFMKSKHPIKIYYSIVKNKKYKCCEISITSSRLIKDLKNLNIVPTKSKILKPSIISEEYVNSYILGLIDGDGCFSLDKKNQLHLNVISSLSICQFVMDTLVKKCNITATKIIPEKRSKGIYYCYFGGNTKIAKIVNYIYKNNSCFLERKFKIANR
jgi:hypothetical protein